MWSTFGSSRSAANSRGSALRLLVEVAAAHVFLAELVQRRLLGVADRLGEAAAVGEHAAGQLVAQVRQEARRSCRGARDPCAGRRAGCNAGGRPCTGAAGSCRTGVDRPLLDQPTRIEDADPRAHLRDDAEVVADEEHRGLELGLQGGDEVEHLRLDRRVEAGRGLVEDEERRVLGKRHRDHDSLLHPARELVRVAVHDRPGSAICTFASASSARCDRLRSREPRTGTPPRPVARRESTGSTRCPGSGRPSRRRSRAASVARGGSARARRGLRSRSRRPARGRYAAGTARRRARLSTCRSRTRRRGRRPRCVESVATSRAAPAGRDLAPVGDVEVLAARARAPPSSPGRRDAPAPDAGERVGRRSSLRPPAAVRRR